MAPESEKQDQEPEQPILTKKVFGLVGGKGKIIGTIRITHPDGTYDEIPFNGEVKEI